MASYEENDTTGQTVKERELPPNKPSDELLPEFSRKVSISESIVIDDNDDDHLDKNKGEKSMAKDEKLGREETNEADSKSISSHKEGAHESAVGKSHSAYRCNCGECFEKSAELAAHKRWTCLLVEKKLQCDICKSWFAHKGGLRRHMKHSHEGVFSCAHCPLKFHNKLKLTRHWMEFHYGDKKDDKLKCFLCGDDSFNSKYELEAHLLIHKYNRINSKKKFCSAIHNQHIDLTQSNDGCVTTASNCSQNSAIPSLHTSSAAASMSAHATAESSFPFHRHYSHLHNHREQLQHQNSASNNQDTSRVGSLSAHTSQHNVTHHPEHPSVFPSHHPPPPHHYSPHLPAHHPPHPPPPPHHLPPPHHPPPPRPPLPPHTNPPFHMPPFWHNSAIPEPHQQFPFFRKHCKKHHHNKWKWKKYFKDMMCQYFSPPVAHGYYPDSQTSNQNPQFYPETMDNQSQFTKSGISASSMSSASATPTPEPSDLDSVHTSSTFKMICKFCDQVIEKGMAAQHRLRDCPFTCAFKCNVCDKVFRKRHKLLQHMIDYGHYLNKTDTSLNPASSAASDTSSISNLYQKLDSVLHLRQTKHHAMSAADNSEQSGKSSEFQHLSHLSKLENMEQPNNSTPERRDDKDVTGSGPSTNSGLSFFQEKNVNQILDPYIDTKKSDMDKVDGTVGVNVSPSVNPLDVLQCSVCHVKFNSIHLLCVHLQSHITHVSAIQKVHEWKEKSSQYFSDSDHDKEDPAVFSFSYPESSVDSLSIATNDTSVQDAGSISTHNSTLTTVVENSSLKGNTITESEKWHKPHCKKKRKTKGLGETYRCEHCDESFSFKKCYSRHMKEKHPEKRMKLECPVCQKKFSWRKRGQFYERHLSSHYGVTIFKYKCEFCDKTFLEKCKLQSHMAVQHNKAEELLHKCHVCGKAYGTKSSLTRHLRHHTGDKPHKCGICQKSFREKRELTRHTAAHTGVPAFVCLHCGQGFTLKTSLDTHIKRKHSQPS